MKGRSMALRSASRTFTKLAPALALAAALTTPAQAQKKMKVVGFYPDYSSGGISNTQASELSYTIYFSIKPPTDGNVSDEYIINSIDAGRMIDMVEQGKKKGMGVLLCVGGAAESANFPALAGNASASAKFASTLAAFCTANGLAGVDIDWEFPGGGGSYAFTTLSKALHTVFAPKGLLLSTNVNGPDNSQYTAEALQQYDAVQIMSYDNDWPPGSSPHSTLSAAQQHLGNYAAKIGSAYKSKLLLGVPFFGKGSGVEPKSYRDILTATPGLDPTLDNSGSYNFNGTNTLAQKTNYVIEQGYGGIMIWNLVQDAVDARLLTSINTAIKAKGYVVDQAPVPINNRLQRVARDLYGIRPWDGEGRVRLHNVDNATLSLYSPDGRSLGAAHMTYGANAPLPLAAGRALYRIEGEAGARATGSAATLGR